ncbi:MAG: hypothetical protein IPG92_16115 [Flavobacteriales bacterium]|nr:hypothetical protein [Flavobacteriales bacterium]
MVLTLEGYTVFKSGRVNSDYEVEGHDAGYEPHHDMINAPDQVQIYELVMGDVNGNVTTVLERAKDPIKDNRLTPIGFSTTHPSYDTTRIAGVPGTDTDFNHNSIGEGSGSDVVHYHVPVTSFTGDLRAFARIYYQPVPPGWNAEMFSQSGTQIDAFRDMLEASDRSPTLVASDSLLVGPVGFEGHARGTRSGLPRTRLPTVGSWSRAIYHST